MVLQHDPAVLVHARQAACSHQTELHQRRKTATSLTHALHAAGVPLVTVGCDQDAITSIGTTTTEVTTPTSDQPWAQLCSSTEVCGMGDTMSVGCLDMNSDGVGGRLGDASSQHVCAANEIVQAMYVRWDGNAVHGLDGIRCRRALLLAAFCRL